MLARAVSKGVLSIAAWTVVKIVVSAIATPILARLLGVEGYGQYAYYLAIIFLASPFSNLGSSNMLTKYIAERPYDPTWRNSIAAYAGAMTSMGSMIVAIIVAPFVYPHVLQDTGSWLLVPVIVGAVLFEQGWYFSKGILYGIHREELASLPATFGAILSAVLGVSLALSGLGILGALLGLMISNLLVAVVTLRFASRHLHWPGIGNVLKTIPFSRMRRFSFLSMAFTALSMVLYRADIILVRRLAGDSQAGLYATAVQWSEFVWFIPISVEAVMLQSTARLWASNKTEEITSIVSRLLRYVGLGSAFFLTIVFVFADKILRVYYGPAFEEANLALRLLIPGVFSFCFARVMWPVIQARGNVFSIVSVIAGVTLANLVLNWILILEWGAVGAAAATSLTYGSVAFVYLNLFRRYGVHPFRGFRGWRLLLICILTGAAILPVSNLISSPVPSLLAGGVLATCVFVAGLLRLGLLTVEEVSKIVEALPQSLRTWGRKFFLVMQPVLSRLEARKSGALDESL